MAEGAADEVRTAPWIKTCTVTNQLLVRALQQELDAGEAESIALALEIDAELLFKERSRWRIHL